MSGRIPVHPERALTDARRRVRIAALALAGFTLLAVAPPAPGDPSPQTPATAGEAYAQRPLDFPAIDGFLDAIAIEAQTELIIDRFWQPAIEALVAANPDRAAEVRAFGDRQRTAELQVYRPIVAMMLDSDAVELLHPEVIPQLEALLEEGSREYARDRSVSAERIGARALRAERIRSGPAGRVNGELQAMTRLAMTPDGLALRQINHGGLFWCVGPGHPSEHHREECAPLLASPVLARLRLAPLGEKLILLSAAAHGTLAGMVAMGHAAGISLHRLLPPERVSAAGLNVPPDMSLEELTASSRTAGSQ